MALLQIKKYGDQILEKPTSKVDVIDKEVKKIARDMLETMYAVSGLGLAANQVGIELSIATINISENGKEQDTLILINPEIIYEEGKISQEEGCLSFPQIYVSIERPKKLIVEAKSINGEYLKIEAEDLLARVISHECDHLKGILFIDRLNPLTRKMVKKKISKKMKEGEW